MKTIITAFALSLGLSVQEAGPVISSITPKNPVASRQAQALVINGDHFGRDISLLGGNFATTGLKVSVTDPTGTVRLADSLDKVTPVSVVFRVKFEFSGRYEIIVTNPNGETSNTVVVTVN